MWGEQDGRSYFCLLPVFFTDGLPPDWCVFKSWEADLERIPDNCTSLVGVLDYRDRAFSDQEMAKLRQLRQIYGNINLNNVRITNLSMFSALERIISLNGENTFTLFAV